MLKFTEVLKYHKIRCSRKFVQTFANGLCVYTYSLKPNLSNSLSIVSISMFLTIPLVLSVSSSTRSNSFPLFQELPCVSFSSKVISPLRNMLTLLLSESTTHHSFLSLKLNLIFRFVYYFLNQRNEEFEVLTKALQGDALNIGRLNLLATRLRREAVSATRITRKKASSFDLIHF